MESIFLIYDLDNKKLCLQNAYFVNNLLISMESLLITQGFVPIEIKINKQEKSSNQKIRKLKREKTQD